MVAQGAREAAILVAQEAREVVISAAQGAREAVILVVQEAQEAVIPAVLAEVIRELPLAPEVLCEAVFEMTEVIETGV